MSDSNSFVLTIFPSIKFYRQFQHSTHWLGDLISVELPIMLMLNKWSDLVINENRWNAWFCKRIVQTITWCHYWAIEKQMEIASFIQFRCQKMIHIYIFHSYFECVRLPYSKINLITSIRMVSCCTIHVLFVHAKKNCNQNKTAVVCRTFFCWNIKKVCLPMSVTS